MKITGLDIGDYRQFKNIKFDFTYPEDHPHKAGKPLDKVCFIGQSGTGKTTLLNAIWEYVQILSKLLEIYDRKELNFDLDNFLESELFDIIYKSQLNGREVKYNRIIEIEKSDKQFLEDWFEKQFSKTDKYHLIDRQDKLCIYIKDSISREADAFLFEQTDQKNSFFDFVKTDTQIEQNKIEYNERLKSAGRRKSVSLGELYSISTWQYLLRDVENYDEASRTLVKSLMQKVQGVSPTVIVEELQKWIKRTPNPRVELAEKCLNPILENFFLEVDPETGGAPITIRTKKGVKINSSYLSTGARQILSTAIPIFKFNTKDCVILFDEPERSLFPDIQRKLIKYYTSLAPEAQFFFATHSPIIASAFEPCERFILYFDENGEVKYRNGVTPIGDDPNDILHADFGLQELMLDEGLDAYKKYRQLGSLIRQETDEKKKNELIAERVELGNRYNF